MDFVSSYENSTKQHYFHQRFLDTSAYYYMPFWQQLLLGWILIFLLNDFLASILKALVLDHPRG